MLWGSWEAWHDTLRAVISVIAVLMGAGLRPGFHFPPELLTLQVETESVAHLFTLDFTPASEHCRGAPS